MDAKDRQKNPYMVLDTDYKTYLIMFRCREEFRKPQPGDDLGNDQEDYRQQIEDFDEEIHPKKTSEKIVFMN